jgi:VanZ family protein
MYAGGRVWLCRASGACNGPANRPMSSHHRRRHVSREPKAGETTPHGTTPIHGVAMAMNIARLVIRLSGSPWLRFLALLGLAALAFVSLIPAEHSPPRTQLPGSVEHFLAYASVSALTAFAFQRAARTWLLAGTLIGYAAVLEYFQHWSPGRSASVMDFIGSSAGVLVGIGVCLLVLHAVARLEQVVDRR